MILDHNLTSNNVYYNSTGINDEIAEAKELLESYTNNWIGNPRIITADEIARITNNTSFNGATSNGSEVFYFDTNNNTLTTKTEGASKYAWLFDYTHYCTDYGCNVEFNSPWTVGYWTSTKVNDSTGCVRVVYDGKLDYISAGYSGLGIRPIITISKSIFN